MKRLSLLIFCLVLLCPASPLAAGASPPAGVDDPGDGWHRLTTVGNITVNTRRMPESDIFGFMAVGVLDAPIDQVMEVLRDVERTTLWQGGVSEKSTVESLGDMEAITYSINPLPWPFADRELLLRNRLHLDEQQRALVVDVYSENMDHLPVRPGLVRAQLYCGQMLLRPADTGKTHIRLILMLDPRGRIPAWLVNLVQRSIPVDFLKALEQRAQTTAYTLRPAFKRILQRLKQLTPDAPTRPGFSPACRIPTLHLP